jgi:hypothetical protein
MDAKTLRERIADARAKGGRIPAELQLMAVTYAERRHAAGTSWKTVGVELGMSWHTLLYWRDRMRPRSDGKLARVEVVSEAPASTPGFVVHAPGGLRIEHMSVLQAAELIARLR